MPGVALRSLAALMALQSLATAAVLAAFVALAVRALALALLDRGRGVLVALLRLSAGLGFLAAAAGYGIVTATTQRWGPAGSLIAVATAALLLALPLYRGLRGQPLAGRMPGLVGFLLQAVAFLLLIVVALLTLMRAGFVALSEDRPLLLVDVTGETGSQRVHWAPADQPAREEQLTTHRVVLRTPENEPVAEGWIYGDQVAIKGRVLRLSPLLNAAGLPNLYELQFLHNGYESAESHNQMPHVALPLPAMGPLAVHPWWRPWQERLLARWEQGTTTESPWVVRSVTTESTYYPLVDAQDRPVKQIFRLVLTPGGLSSS